VMDTARARVIVLYVGGAGRSGSTLLDRMLGELPGFAAVGELRYLWREGLIDNRLCGCGNRFHECAFWSMVGRHAFGGWDGPFADRLVGLERSVARQRHLPLLYEPAVSRRYRTRLEAFTSVLSRLYMSIAEIAPARVVVDSTKDPAYGFLLRQVPGIDLRIVHLVRDSRGVAFSWSKRVPTRDYPDRDTYMHRFGAGTVGLRWDIYNSLIELLGRTGPKEIRVRYEDLIEAPRRELGRIADLVEAPPDPASMNFVGDGKVIFGVHHIAAGNPMRAQAGALPLRRDEAWRTRMAPGPRRVVSAITWPLLRRYGYVAGLRSSGTDSTGRP
jgi:hypothetical protein